MLQSEFYAILAVCRVCVVVCCNLCKEAKWPFVVDNE